MYWFGKNINTPEEWQQLWPDPESWDLSSQELNLSERSISEIIKILDKFSRESFDEIIPLLEEESGFTGEQIRETLALLPGLLSRDSLLKRLRAEFYTPDVLDRFIRLPGSKARVMAVPRGLSLHVTAGNVFLGSIDSLLMGLLTKNLSILKVSSSNKIFPFYFAQKLSAFDQDKIIADKFAVVHWKGGEEGIESFFKGQVQTILAWGGEEMIQNYRHRLPVNVKLLDFGPKISLQILTKDSLVGLNLQDVCRAIISDIIPWDQSACASPQNLYIQEGIDEASLMNALDEAFNQAPPRGQFDDDEATEILKEKYRGYWSELMEEGKIIEGANSLVHFEKNRYLKPSPLNRSLIIKKFQDEKDLFQYLRPFSTYLQSCSYLLSSEEKDKYLQVLIRTGIKRFAPLGTITLGMEGAPHDGRFVLRELVHFVGDEERMTLPQSFSAEVKKTNDFISRPLLMQSEAGYLFSSGATTGAAKFVHYSHDEFDLMSELLAENFRHQGLSAGTTVANLFVAGNLWSSFLCVDRALEKLGVLQLPIGGLCPVDNVLDYLQKFKPQVIMGIPSLLLLIAQKSEEMKISLKIPTLFFAGESLSQARKDFFNKVWATTTFGSAGYASVEAGVIGYQCRNCQPGEHHLFSDYIDLQIIHEEGFVTSLARKNLPFKHYRTGDRMKWVEAGQCDRPDQKFKLLGRSDSLIFIWSCRMALAVIEQILNQKGVMTFQLIIKENLSDQKLSEDMILHYEYDSELHFGDLTDEIYKASQDVCDTVSLEFFRQHFSLKKCDYGQIKRNERTGKIRLILDQRHEDDSKVLGEH